MGGPTTTASSLENGVHFSYVNENAIEGDLRCPMCHQVFSDPQMFQCGDMFCSKCINVLKTEHESSKKASGMNCPSCSTDVTSTLAVPRMISNMLGNLKVTCCTCNKEMSRAAFTNHYWNDCEINCPHKCGANMMRARLADHEHSECPNKPIKCTAWDVGCEHACHHTLLAQHTQVCAFVQLRPVLLKLNSEVAYLKRDAEERNDRRAAKLEKKRLEEERIARIREKCRHLLCSSCAVNYPPEQMWYKEPNNKTAYVGRNDTYWADGHYALCKTCYPADNYNMY